MSLPRRALLGWAAATALPACHAGACVPVAAAPLALADGYPIVPARIGGAAVSLVLDTGAQGMLVTPEVADALALPLAGMTRVYGTGGSQETRVVALPALYLGGATMPAQLAPVAPLPVAIPAEPPVGGLLGASLLSQFDLLIDVPGRRVALSLPGSCALPRGARLPLDLSPSGEPYAMARVEGQPLLALLDTGSRATLIGEAAARRLGLTAPVAASTARGVDGGLLPLRYVRARVALGEGPATEMPISITPLQLDRGEMLIGLDLLGRRPLFLSYSTGEAVIGP